MSEHSKSMTSSAGDTPKSSQSVEEGLTKLQNLLHTNQNESTERQRVAQERARIDEQWVKEEIKNCEGIYEELDRIAREGYSANTQTGSQNAGVA
jgi:hypothetical protein